MFALSVFIYFNLIVAAGLLAEAERDEKEKLSFGDWIVIFTLPIAIIIIYFSDIHNEQTTEDTEE